MTKGLINRILPFSCVDGPGNRSVVFFQGCNFSCAYCHNPETIGNCNLCNKCVKACPGDALRIEENRIIYTEKLCSNCDNCIKICPLYSDPRSKLLSVKQVIDFIQETSPFISGVTLSGGECTLQMAYLHKLVKSIKLLGLNICVDTNGSVPLWKHEQFVNDTDMFILDIKAYDSAQHRELTNADNSIVLKNFKYLNKKSKLYEIRTVVVPGLLNNEETVSNISQMIAEFKPELRYKLIKCQPHALKNDLLSQCPPENRYMESLKKMAENNKCKNIIVT